MPEKNIIEKLKEDFEAKALDGKSIEHYENRGVAFSAKDVLEYFEQFLLTEFKALKDEVVGEEKLEIETTGPLDYQDGFSAGYNDHRYHTKEVFEKFGIK